MQICLEKLFLRSYAGDFLLNHTLNHVRKIFIQPRFQHWPQNVFHVSSIDILDGLTQTVHGIGDRSLGRW